MRRTRLRGLTGTPQSYAKGARMAVPKSSLRPGVQVLHGRARKGKA